MEIMGKSVRNRIIGKILGIISSRLSTVDLYVLYVYVRAAFGYNFTFTFTFSSDNTTLIALNSEVFKPR